MVLLALLQSIIDCCLRSLVLELFVRIVSISGTDCRKLLWSVPLTHSDTVCYLLLRCSRLSLDSRLVACETGKAPASARWNRKSLHKIALAVVLSVNERPGKETRAPPEAAGAFALQRVK